MLCPNILFKILARLSVNKKNDNLNQYDPPLVTPFQWKGTLKIKVLHDAIEEP